MKFYDFYRYKNHCTTLHLNDKSNKIYLRIGKYGRYLLINKLLLILLFNFQIFNKH